MDTCLCCKIAAKMIPAKTVWEDDAIVAFEDINPQAPVHALIVPKAHRATLNDATEEDRALLGSLMLVAKEIAREKGLDSKGYRLVLNTQASAGQSVFHVHLHLLGGRTFSWPPG